MPATDPVFGPPLIKGDRSCPDCQASPGIPCHPRCPRRTETPDDAHDRAFEQAQAGDHPDGF